MEGTPPSSLARVSHDRRGLSALAFAVVGLACSPILVRVSELGPTATAFHRLALAVPFLVLWIGLEPRPQARDRRVQGAGDYARLALAGLFFAGDLGVWHWSIRLTSVANSTLLANLSPIIVTLGAWLLFRERFGPRFLAGLVMALAGTAILAGADLKLGRSHLIGDGLGVLTAVFYGAYILTVKDLRRRFSTATVMAWTTTVAAVALVPAVLASGESFVAVTLEGWTVLLALALVSQIGGQGFLAYALAHLPAAFSSVSLLAQPILAAVFAWILLAEPMGGLQALGIAVVLGGIALARQASRAA
ncbi:MAG: DMT family transporter [Alphaproteobacteria bacterium]